MLSAVFAYYRHIDKMTLQIYSMFTYNPDGCKNSVGRTECCTKMSQFNARITDQLVGMGVRMMMHLGLHLNINQKKCPQKWSLAINRERSKSVGGNK
jgi:hypothetical protein